MKLGRVRPLLSARQACFGSAATLFHERRGSIEQHRQQAKWQPRKSAHSEQFTALAARWATPAIYPIRWFADIGGLTTYGADTNQLNLQMGTYIGKILLGAKPAELPIQQSTKVELVINLKTAKVLGLAVPLELLARADEVIE